VQLIAIKLVGIATVGICWNQKMIMDTTLREISYHYATFKVYFNIFYTFLCVFVCVVEIPYLIFWPFRFFWSKSAT
jgi:hypothetical protein